MYVYYVIAFFTLLLGYTIFRKKWGISSYLLTIYLFSLLVSLLIMEIVPFFQESKDGSIVFCSALAIFFFPFMKTAPEIKSDTNPLKVHKLISVCKITSYVLIFLSIVIIPVIISAMHTDFNELREGSFSYSGNFITSIGLRYLGTFAHLSYAMMVVFFYLFTFFDGYKKEKCLFFIASMSAPYNGMLYGGRTQMIYWLLAVGFNLILFHKYLSAKKKKVLYMFLLIIVSIVFVYIVAATISRFADSKAGVNGSLLSYIGQPYINFCNFYENYPTVQNISLCRIFPFTNYLLNGPFDLQKYRVDIFTRSGMDIGIFYTMLGDFLVDIGVKGIYVYAIVYAFLSYLITRKKSLYIYDLLILSLLFMIPLQGVFYYSYWQMPVTFCASVVLVFSRYFKKQKHE